MKKKNLLRIYTEDNGTIRYVCEDREKAVLAATYLIREALSRGDQGPMNLQFATTVHLLASDTSGKLEKQYIEKLCASVAEMRAQLKTDQK